jgi:hypothetical protein
LALFWFVTYGWDCWLKIKIKKQIGVSGHAPDCATGYLEHARRLAHSRCEDAANVSNCFRTEMKRMEQQGEDQAWSMIEYPVSVDLANPIAKPTGRATACWPQE